MPKTILVVDRQVVMRRMLRFAMELQGHRVLDFDCADEARTFFAGGARIGLLIVGLDPGQRENGELVSHLREGKDWVDLPILLIGEKRQEDCRDLPEAGGCAWLDKPFRMHEIHAMVESLLRDVAGTGVREAGSVERPRDA